MAAPAGIVVGYALREKRVKSFITPELLEDAAKSGDLKYVAVDQSLPLAEQGPFDLLLHKLEGDDWARQLSEYETAHPETVIIDQYAAVHRLDDRLEMLQAVENLDPVKFGAPIEAPKQLSIAMGVDPKDIEKIVADSGLKLPFVAKPVEANGTSNSHQLCLVVTKSALGLLETPVILQEFKNHGGILFKLYVLGDKVMVFKRQSLPDVPISEGDESSDATSAVLEKLGEGNVVHSGSIGDMLKQGAGLVEFNRISNVHMTEEEMNDGRVSDPPPELMQSLGLELRKRLGLQTFNVDILREGGKGDRYYVVDINYMPGYERLPDYPELLRNFVQKQVEKRRAKLAGQPKPAVPEGQTKPKPPPPATPYPVLVRSKKWTPLRAALKLGSLKIAVSKIKPV